jgi:hypothetical protein
VTDLPIDTDDRLSQPEKASYDISVTESGILTAVRAVYLNAPSPITVTDLPIVIDDRLEQP